MPKNSTVIALDERGRDLTTVQLSAHFTQWQQSGRDVTFVIGGADGLDPESKQRADMLLRISSLTLPHGMVRVLLAEQLYRAWSITQNHPYHRT
jgi:23S rRNA (pseudouridine1915-N3)-methyltransferase